LEIAMKSKRLVATLAFLVAVAGAAHGGSMGNGAGQRLAAAVKRCLAMPHDQMMQDSGCKSLMAQHPEMFPSNGTKSDNETH
jgi:hypothetical protein